MARQLQTLDSWIAECLADVDKLNEKNEIKKCTAFSLVHMSGLNVEKEVHAVKLGSKTVTPADLARLFKHKAEGYSQELQGPQTFRLLAFYDNEPEYSASHPFKLNGMLVHEGLETEAPTEMGQRAQNMRLTERLVDGAFRDRDRAAQTTLDVLRELAVENRNLRAEARQNNEMLLAALTANIQLAQSRHLEITQQETLRSLAGMAPALINSLTGRQVFSEASEDTVLLKAILTNANPEAIRSFLQTLPPDVMRPVISRFERIAQEQLNAQKAAAPTIAKDGRTEVERDAAAVEGGE